MILPVFWNVFPLFWDDEPRHWEYHFHMIMPRCHTFGVDIFCKTMKKTEKKIKSLKYYILLGVVIFLAALLAIIEYIF